MKTHVLLTLLCVSTFSRLSRADIALSVTPSKSVAIPLQILYADGKHQRELATLASAMQRDFMFTGQIQADITIVQKFPHKKELHTLYDKGILFAVMLMPIERGYEWHLYDTMNGQLLGGTKYLKKGSVSRGWAHHISDEIWKILTGNDGFFSTKIAYSKLVRSKRGKDLKYICVADYDGSNEQVLVDTKTINVAPRWNNDHRHPLLFYSDFTNHNVRLVISDMHKRRTIVSDFDGINMVPSFSQDGKKVVYCLSRGDGNCQLYLCQRGIFKKLTHNTGNNVSPTFADDRETVFFCSDFETGNPQLYAYNVGSKKIDRLTDGGYCASPRYNRAAQKIAYAKLIEGTMQLCLYDVQNQTCTQVTFDKGNKEEFAWSPCGTRLIYSVEEPGKTSRLAMMNLASRDCQFLTSEDSHCTFPDWSPVYEEYPTVA